jgi:hypothetical protein
MKKNNVELEQIKNQLRTTGFLDVNALLHI